MLLLCIIFVVSVHSCAPDVIEVHFGSTGGHNSWNRSVWSGWASAAGLLVSGLYHNAKCFLVHSGGPASERVHQHQPNLFCVDLWACKDGAWWSDTVYSQLQWRQETSETLGAGLLWVTTEMQHTFETLCYIFLLLLYLKQHEFSACL